MNRRQFLSLLLAPAARGARLGKSVEVIPGPVNGVIVNRNGKRLAVYGDSRPAPAALDQVLLTHSRRDVCWAAIEPGRRGARISAPSREARLIASPETFWKDFEKVRFHDYAMVNTKVLAEGLPVAREVSGGDRIEWQDLAIEVLDTPGYSPGAVSYLFTADDRRIACVGDLIYGSGHLFDLYSLQDAVPEAKFRGYHGYAARAHELLRSLRLIASRNPDILIPARGPVIDRPAAAIAQLIDRLKAVLREHFSTDALRFYAGDDNLKLRAGKLLEGEVPEWMPMAAKFKLPDWVLAFRNSRLLISDSGSAFLVDCGFDAVIEFLEKLRAKGRFRTLEGIFITHYHDDHTDRAQACADRFQCPVYFTEELADILENPRSYRMPCLSPFPIRSGKPLKQGTVMRWHEFEFTFSYFPGQTLLHDSLLAKRTGGEAVLFAGDSFTPSGMDDYCLWNRNFVASRRGYRQCLEYLRGLPPGHLIVNQHVEPAFRFTSEQIDYMVRSLDRRAEAMRRLFPWPAGDFGIDEQWVRLSPYEVQVQAGQPIELRAVIWNHMPQEQEYRIRPVLPPGWRSDRREYRVRAKLNTEASIPMLLEKGDRGNYLITVDVEFANWRLRQWAEALVRIA
jgi:glyoxylase-like metal-dependent hydrolase (beta-lactamase superfamily II)